MFGRGKLCEFFWEKKILDKENMLDNFNEILFRKVIIGLGEF